MRYWNGSQWKDHHENAAKFDVSDTPPAQEGPSIDTGPHPDGQVFLGEACEHCGERVRYWNIGAVGNCACGCTVEGPEVVEPIGPQHELEATEEFYRVD